LRIAKFKQRIVETMASQDLSVFRSVLEQMQSESDAPLIDLAAALASLSQGKTPLLLVAKHEAPAARPRDREPEFADRGARDTRDTRDTRGTRPARDSRDGPPIKSHERRGKAAFARFDTFRIEVGAAHGIRPGNIVGAIANEAGIDGSHIGKVDIRDDHSLVGLPEGMPEDIFNKLQKVRVAGRELRISFVDQREESGMSKGMERKKEQKKKPSKTLEEKRAAKKEKKAARG
jgi:ATP-dependent RNA helicase DeaD